MKSSKRHVVLLSLIFLIKLVAGTNCDFQEMKTTCFNYGKKTNFQSGAAMLR